MMFKISTAIVGLGQGQFELLDAVLRGRMISNMPVRFPNNRRVSFYLMLLILHFIPTCAVAKSAHSGKDSLDYTLQAVQEGEHSRIHVLMTFTGDASGRGMLQLPKEEGDGNSFSTPVQALHSSSPDVQLGDTPDPFIKSLIYPPGKRVQVAYDLVQSWPGSLVAHGIYRQKAILQKDYFHSFGSAFWVVPNWPKSEPHVITIHWSGLPPGWTVGNSFGAGQLSQTFRASLEEMLDGIYIGGDFRIGRVCVRGKPIYIALRGQVWTFKDDDLNECVRRVVMVERDFWKDYHLAYLLVTLIPTQDEAGTFAGQGRTNAFALFLPQATGLNYFFKHTLAHELFHLWLPGQMNNLDPPIWFFEGFTDYYASRLLLRSRIASVEDAADFYNMRLKEYYLSPVRNISDEQARKDLFKSNANFQLPYERGLLLASKWDQDLQSASGGRYNLDHVMQGLLKIAHKKTSRQFGDVLLALLKPFLKEAAEADLLHYIRDGWTFSPYPQTLGSGARLQKQKFQSPTSGDVQVPQFYTTGQ